MKEDMISLKDLEELFAVIEDFFGKKFERPMYERTLKLWQAAFRGYSLEEVNAALEAYVVVSAFPPKPSDLIALCEKERARIGKIKGEVAQLARNAVNDFPSNGEEERDEAITIYLERCYECGLENSIKRARKLSGYLYSIMHYISDKDRDEAKELMKRLKPITDILRDYEFEE